jgi:hypothetical protein
VSMRRYLDLGTWDIPYNDIDDIYIIDGPDSISYLVVVAYGLDIMIYADEDPGLVARAMDAISDAAELGCTAVPLDPGVDDDD